MITNLYKVRYERGLTQSALAKLSGVSHQSIRAYEEGWRDINNATLSSLLNLAETLRVPIYRILDDPTTISRLYKVERGGLL